MSAVLAVPAPVQVDEQRRCSACRHMLPLSRFPLRAGSTMRRQSACKPCRNAYNREHYMWRKVEIAEAERPPYQPDPATLLLRDWRVGPSRALALLRVSVDPLRWRIAA